MPSQGFETLSLEVLHRWSSCLCFSMRTHAVQAKTQLRAAALAPLPIVHPIGGESECSSANRVARRGEGPRRQRRVGQVGAGEGGTVVCEWCRSSKGSGACAARSGYSLARIYDTISWRAMPTNLPPEYFEADKRFRAAQSTAEKIARLEELMGTIPKHKGTDKLRADYRRRLSKLKEAVQTKKRPGRQESAYNLDKEGAGQVVVAGPPNAGKSAPVRATTNAPPKASEAPFTTWEPTPGMMPYEDVQVQLIDTPPLNEEYMEAGLLDLLRRADLILLGGAPKTHP